jgi:hypothetical protein
VPARRNDMLAEPRPDPVEDALEYRLAPGSGPSTSRAGRPARLGVSAPLAVEVLSRDHNKLPLAETAAQAVPGARSGLAAARVLVEDR